MTGPWFFNNRNDVRYDAHPVADIFPMLTENELRELAADIGDNGLKHAVCLYEGKILDGRNRAKACAIAGVTPTYTAYDGQDPVGFVLSMNLRRRHLDQSQRAMAASKLAGLDKGRKSNVEISTFARTQSEAARDLKVSRESVIMARHVIEDGVPELADAVASGAVAVSAAAEVAKLPKAEQMAAVKSGPKTVKALAKKVKDAKKKKADAAPAPKPVNKPGDAETDSGTDEQLVDVPHNVPAPSAGKLATYYRNDGVPEMPGVYRPRITKNAAGHETVLDAYDNPAPPNVGDTFTDPALRDILATVLSAAELVNQAYENFIELKAERKAHHRFPWADIPTVKKHIEAARNAVIEIGNELRAAIPYAVCPACSGARQGCKECRLSGYWPKTECDVYPQRFRKGAA